MNSIHQIETARLQPDRFEQTRIHGGKFRSKYNTCLSPRQVFTSANYMRHLGELYQKVKSISGTGIARGIESPFVLEGITVFALCSRNGLDALDVWQVAMDAHRAAVREAHA